MKKEKIEELWNNHRTTALVEDFDEIWELMFFEHFKNAIIEAEYEWYKKLEKKLDRIAYLHYEDIPRETRLYYNEIKEKIKELENDR